MWEFFGEFFDDYFVFLFSKIMILLIFKIVLGIIFIGCLVSDYDIINWVDFLGGLGLGYLMLFEF